MYKTKREKKPHQINNREEHLAFVCLLSFLCLYQGNDKTDVNELMQWLFFGYQTEGNKQFQNKPDLL